MGGRGVHIFLEEREGEFGGEGLRPYTGLPVPEDVKIGPSVIRVRDMLHGVHQFGLNLSFLADLPVRLYQV